MCNSPFDSLLEEILLLGIYHYWFSMAARTFPQVEWLKKTSIYYSKGQEVRNPARYSMAPLGALMGASHVRIKLLLLPGGSFQRLLHSTKQIGAFSLFLWSLHISHSTFCTVLFTFNTEGANKMYMYCKKGKHCIKITRMVTTVNTVCHCRSPA